MMFNSPLLDIAIGLVFIFLLYSLLVTSINEAVATFFNLRAKMLKSAIVVGMLSNTSKDNRWLSLYKGISSFFIALLHWEKEPSKESYKIGDKFFDHPLIKNYGSNRFFPIPSYISTKNFSTVLMDVLRKDFDSKVNEIARTKSALNSTDSLENITQALHTASDTTKIKELLNYYKSVYLNLKEGEIPQALVIIDEDTLEILQMHLHNSGYDIKQFEIKIEGWFDDSMNRVSGWYKRQTQLILFLLGLFVAIIFNVDTIEIAGKLSTDKDARDKLVQLATQAVDKYKNDPRVKKVVTSSGDEVLATDSISQINNNAIFHEYQMKVDSVKSLLKVDVNHTKEILAAGWGNYGGATTHHEKVLYVLSTTFTSTRKILGFLILAFAVSLGSPFWFDLLNKLVKVRGSGKKEEDAGGSKTDPVAVPVTLVVNPQTSAKEQIT